MTPMSRARVLSGALALGLTAQPSFAEIEYQPRPACTCQNLESLQQEYQNAVYLEGYMRRLAAHLKAEEDRLTALQSTSNSDVDGNVDIYSRTLNMRTKYRAENMHLPFPTTKDYHGPEEVPMPFGTCEQDKNDLKAMNDGSVCAAIADMALEHEKAHRDLCVQMHAGPYWARPLSDLMLEEAEMYKVQAAKLKAELRKVLDEATVTLRGKWRLQVSGNGVEMVYLFENQSGDIGAASDGDIWTMTGTGETVNSIESMKLPGTKCKSSGAVHNQLDFVMTTDGLTFSLEVQERSSKGDLQVNCGGGLAMSMPASSLGGGTIATGLALVAGDNPLPPSYLDPVKAAMSTGGMKTSGEPDTVVSVICPAP